WTRIFRSAATGLVATAVVTSGLVLTGKPEGEPEPPPRPPAVTSVPPHEAGGQATARTGFAAEAPREGIVTGRVLDPDGRPVAGASVAALARAILRRNVVAGQLHVLGQATTDDAGRYRLSIPRDELDQASNPYLLATAPGFGFKTWLIRAAR